MTFTFFEITFITATKSFPDEKLGLLYKVNPGGTVVEKVLPGGLLSKTNLKPGQEIANINGNLVAGLSRASVAEILASITTDICLEVWTPIQCTRDAVPTFLSEEGSSPVPLHKWKMIYDSVQNEMLPAVKAMVDLSSYFDYAMRKYIRCQMIKGCLIGCGTESSHERRIFTLTNHMASASNTATLCATNTLCTANAMLNSHGISAKLGFVSSVVPKISNSLPSDPILRTPSDIGFYSTVNM